MPPATAAPWVLVAGGFHPLGGMDQLNAALVRELLARDTPVHLVTHQVDESLRDPFVTVHLVGKSAGSIFLGQRLLDQRGRAVAAAVTARNPSARVLVNGVNCAWPDINWVHFVNHAWPPRADTGPRWLRVKSRFEATLTLRRERAIIPRSRLLIANSEGTRRELVEGFALAAERVVTIYPGNNERYAPPPPARRGAARASFGVTDQRPLVAFVGALGYDPRKGFATLWEAWQRLCADPAWRAILLVVGGGRAVPRWRRMVQAAGLADRVVLTGFTDDVASVLAAADLLVSPARYEPYGLNAQEAICSGVPAIVSASAGIGERYTADLKELLLDDPEDSAALAARLRDWSSRIALIKERFEPLGKLLRAHTEQAMARQILEAADFTDGEVQKDRGVQSCPAATI